VIMSASKPLALGRRTFMIGAAMVGAGMPRVLLAKAATDNRFVVVILRGAMDGALPDAVRWRRDKIGFGTPERRWLEEAAGDVRARLASSPAVSRLLRDGAREQWLAAEDATRARRPGLWRLLSVAAWAEQKRLSL